MRLRTPTLLLLLAASAAALGIALRNGGDSPDSIALAAGPNDGASSTPIAPPDLGVDFGPEAAPVENEIVNPSTLDAAEWIGSVDGEVPLRSRPVTQRRVELSSDLDAVIAVTVVSSANHSPMEDVQVTVYLENPEPGQLVTDQPTGTSRGALGASATTDARGFAELAVPADKDLRLALAHKGGVGTRASHRLRALKPQETRRLELPMTRGADQYFLRVVSRQDGAPIAGCSAYFADRTTPASQRSAPDALDSGEGILNLEIGPQAAHWVWIHAPGHASLRVRIGPGHDRPSVAREVALPVESSLQVQVLDTDGAPVRNIVVDVTASPEAVAATDVDARGTQTARWVTRTNVAGWARFQHLVPDAALTIKVHAQNDLTWTNPPPQILSPGEKREISVRRTPGVTIQGQLKAARDTRVSDLELWLMIANRQSELLLQRSMASKVWAKVTTDAEGRYRIQDVPAGEWWLGPAPQDSAISMGGPPPAPRAIWIRVPENQRMLDLDLEVYPALWLSGHVETAKGFSAGRQRLWAKPTSGGDGIIGWSDSEGRFRMGPVTAGTYELAVDAAFAHAGSAPMVLDAGSEAVRIRLRGGGTIQGVAFDPEGGDLEPLEVLVTSADGTLLVKESLSIEGLPDGVHGLFVRSAAGKVGLVEQVKAKAGVPPAEVLVTLEAPAELHIAVVGNYRVWKGAACVGMGEAVSGEPLVLLLPGGSAELERIEDGGPRSMLELTAGERLDLFD